MNAMPTVEGIIEEYRATAGKELYKAVSPPVTLSDIRRHAIAVYWPETPPRRFWDEEFARNTSWGGIVAPEDFNPFAWPITGPGRFPWGHRPAVESQIRGFNAASDARYFNPIRPGDVITAADTALDVYQREGRSGTMLFVPSETRWTNQRGEPVKTQRGTRAFILRS